MATKCNNNITVESLPIKQSIVSDDYLLVYNSNVTSRIKVSDVVFGVENFDFYPELISLIDKVDDITLTTTSNSANWTDTYNTVQANSASWGSFGDPETATLIDEIRLNKDRWNNTATTVESSSGAWETTRITVDLNADRWTTIADIVEASQTQWDSAYAATRDGISAIHEALEQIEQSPWYTYMYSGSGGSGDGSGDGGANAELLNSVYSTVYANSSRWEEVDIPELYEQQLTSVYSNVLANSAQWSAPDIPQLYVDKILQLENDISVVNTNSTEWDWAHGIVLDNYTDWNQTHSKVTADSGNWDSTHNSVRSTSGTWDNATSIVLTNHNKWQDTYNKVTADASKWDSTYNRVQTSGGFWDTAYATVNSKETSWDTAYDRIVADADDWSSTYNTVTTRSALWDATNLKVTDDAADWDRTAKRVDDYGDNWDSAFTKITTTASTWDSIAARVNSSGDDWDRTYMAVISNSAQWAEQTDVTNITSIIRSNSADWNSTFDSSDKWNDLYTFVKSDSGTNNSTYNQATYVHQTGGTITGDITIDSGTLRVIGDIHATGDLYVNKNSIVFSDEQTWSSIDSTKAKSIFNNYFSNSASYLNTVNLVEEKQEEWSISFETVDARGAVWDQTTLRMDTSAEKWDVAEALVQANHTNWTDTYDIVDDNKAFWTEAYTKVDANYSKWNTAYDTILAKEEDWDSAVTILDLRSDKWDATRDTVIANETEWTYAYTQVNANKTHWDNTHLRVSTRGDFWEDTYERVVESGDSWDRTYSVVTTNSAQWAEQTDVTGLTTTVRTNSSYWKDTYSVVSSNSGDWFSPPDLVSLIYSNSGMWNGAYSFVRADSATNNTEYNRNNFVNVSGDEITGDLVVDGNVIFEKKLNLFDELIFGDGMDHHGVVHDETALEPLTIQNVRDFKLIQTTVATNSADWLTPPELTLLVQTNSANWNSVYSTVQANSSVWFSPPELTALIESSSGKWNAAHTFVVTESATNNTEYNKTNFFNVSGDTITGELSVKGDVVFDHQFVVLDGEIIFGDSVHDHDWDHDPTAIEKLSLQDVRDFKSVESSVVATSSDWDSVYSTVNFNSGDWFSPPELTALLQSNSANWISTHTSVHNSSGSWDSVYDSVCATSGTWNNTTDQFSIDKPRWDSVHSFVTADSSTNNTDYNRNTFVNVSGDEITGDLTVNGVLSGTSAIFSSITALSSVVNVIDIKARELSGYDIIDGDLSIGHELLVKGRTGVDSDINLVNGAILFGDGLWDHDVYHRRDLLEELNRDHVVQFKDSYNALITTSANWDSVYNSVFTTSADWNSVYNSVLTTSSTWDSAYNALISTSADWNSVYNSVLTTSSTWDSVYSFVKSDSATNNTHYNRNTFVNVSGDTITGDLNIGEYLYVHHDVNIEHGSIWFGHQHFHHDEPHHVVDVEEFSRENVVQHKSTYASVLTTSANWDSTHASVLATSGNWDSTHASVLATSAEWDSVYSSVCATSSDWDSTHASVLATSGNWDSTHASVLATSAEWDSAYNFVNSDSATNNTEYNRNTFVNVSGDTITGNLDVVGTLSGTNAIFTSITAISSFVDVIDIKVRELSGYEIIDGELVVHDDITAANNLYVTDGAVIFGDSGLYHNVPHNPLETETLTKQNVRDFKSTYNSVLTTSATWDSVYNSVLSTSGYWDSVYSFVNTDSATNNTQYNSTTFVNVTGDTITGSLDIEQHLHVHDDINIEHGSLWFGHQHFHHGEPHHDTNVEELSRENVVQHKSTYASVLTTSANWDSTHASVLATSSDWDSTYNSVYNTSGNWDSVFNSVLTTSATWNSVYVSVRDTSANWDSTHASVLATSGSWDSVYVSVRDTSANWDSVYAFVNSDSATNNTHYNRNTFVNVSGDTITGDLEVEGVITVNHLMTNDPTDRLSLNGGSDRTNGAAIELYGTNNTTSTYDGRMMVFSDDIYFGEIYDDINNYGPWLVRYDLQSKQIILGGIQSVDDHILTVIGTSYFKDDVTVSADISAKGDIYLNQNGLIFSDGDSRNDENWTAIDSINAKSTHASVLATSANWDSVYAFVNSDSATNNTGYNSSTFVNVSGDTMTGDLTVAGQISATTGIFTSLTALSTVINVIDIKARELSGYDIIDGDLKIEHELYVGERIESTNDINLIDGQILFGDGAWDHGTYHNEHLLEELNREDVVQFKSTHASVLTTSGNWDSTHNSVLTTSATWDSVYASVLATSSNWDSTYESVLTTSGYWDSVYDSVCATSGNWDSTYESVLTTSGFWDSTYASVCATSGYWDSVYAFVNSDSATNNTHYNRNTFVNVSGDTITGELTGESDITLSADLKIRNGEIVFGNPYYHDKYHEHELESLTRENVREFKSTHASVLATSGYWDSVYDSVCATSGNWDSTHASVLATSGYWDSVYDSVCATSGYWDSVYSFVNSDSATNNTHYNRNTFVNVSGDTMIGSLVVDDNITATGYIQTEIIKSNDPTSALKLYGGTNNQTGARLELYGANNSNSAFDGRTQLHTNDLYVGDVHDTIDGSKPWMLRIDVDNENFIIGDTTAIDDSMLTVKGDSVLNGKLDVRSTLIVTDDATFSTDIIIPTGKIVLNNETLIGQDIKHFKSTHASVLATSGFWDSTYESVCATSGNWDSTYASVLATSSYWDSTYESVCATSGYWDSVYSFVNSDSATNNTHYNRNTFVNVSGDTITGDLDVIGNINTNIIRSNDPIKTLSLRGGTGEDDGAFIKLFGGNQGDSNKDGRLMLHGDEVYIGDIYDDVDQFNPWVLKVDVDNKHFIIGGLTNKNNSMLTVHGHTTIDDDIKITGDVITSNVVFNGTGDNEILSKKDVRDFKSTESTVFSKSAYWESVYSFVNSDSATNNTEYNRNTFVNVSGDTITGDLTIEGQLSATTGIFTSLTALSTVINVIDIKARELSGYDIIDGDLRIEEELHVGERIESTNDINLINGQILFGDGTWDHDHYHNESFLEKLSREHVRQFKSTHASVFATSSNWDSVYNSVLTTSATWDSVYNSVLTTSATWDSVYASVLATSSNWDSTHASVLATSGNWDSTHASVLATSAEWDSTYDSVCATSGYWDSVYNFVNSDSATNNTHYNRNTFVNVSGDTITGSLEVEQSVITERVMSNDPTSALKLFGGTDQQTGARLELYGANNSNSAFDGRVHLQTNDLYVGDIYDPVDSSKPWMLRIDVDNENFIIGDTTAIDDSMLTVKGKTTIDGDTKITGELTIANIIFNGTGDLEELTKKDVRDFKSTETTLRTNSGRWDDVYAFVNSDSATNNTHYNRSTFVNASGDTITGSLCITDDLVVDGNVWFKGDGLGIINLGDSENDRVVFNGLVDSDIIPDNNKTYNLGASANQWNTIFTTELYASSGISLDDDLFITHGDIIFGDAHWAHGHAHTPEDLEKLTKQDVRNFKSTYESVCATSGFWDSTYESVCATSGYWDSVYDSVCATSGFWDSTYDSVCATSGYWDSVYGSVCATSGYWDSVYDSVCATSGFWDSVYDSVCATSGFWDSTYESVCATSGYWDSTYDSVCATSGYWDSVYNFVNSDSATNNTHYNRNTFVNVSGDTITGDLDVVGTLSGTDAIFTSITALSSVVDVIDIKVRELSGYDIIDGDLRVEGDVTTNRLLLAEADDPFAQTLPSWSTFNLNDNDSSGISDKYKYTHAVNVYGTEDYLINGVLFQAESTGQGVDWELTSGVGDAIINESTTVGESVGQMIDDRYRYIVDEQKIILKGLTVGKKYLFTLYNQAWSTDNVGKQAELTSSASIHSIDITQNEFEAEASDGQLINYVYYANDNQVEFTIKPTDNSTWNLYAFSNREVWYYAADTLLARDVTNFKSTYTTVSTNSGRWESVYNFVNSDSATNNTHYNRNTFVNVSGDTMTGALSVKSDLTIDNDTRLSGELLVGGYSNFTGGVTAENNVYIKGDLRVDGNVWMLANIDSVLYVGESVDDVVVFRAPVDSDIYPFQTAHSSIGNEDKYWKSVYTQQLILSGGIVLEAEQIERISQAGLEVVTNSGNWNESYTQVQILTAETDGLADKVEALYQYTVSNFDDSIVSYEPTLTTFIRDEYHKHNLKPGDTIILAALNKVFILAEEDGTVEDHWIEANAKPNVLFYRTNLNDYDVIDTFDIKRFKSAKYIIEVAGNDQVLFTELTLVTNGKRVMLTEYGMNYTTENPFVEFDATINSVTSAAELRIKQIPNNIEAMWNPGALSAKPYTWLDAADSSSVILNNEGVFSRWENKGRTDLRMRTYPGSEPEYITSGDEQLNGQNVLKFTDDTDFLESEYEDGSSVGKWDEDPQTWYMVFKPTGIDNFHDYLVWFKQFTDEDNQIEPIAIVPGDNDEFFGRVWMGDNELGEGNYPFTRNYSSTDLTGQWNIFELEIDPIYEKVSMYLNGHTIQKDMPMGYKFPRNAQHMLRLHANWVGNEYTDGYFAEFLVLPDYQRIKTEGYLAWKWGLQDKLPEEHTYKNIGPYMFHTVKGNRTNLF